MRHLIFCFVLKTLSSKAKYLRSLLQKMGKPIYLEEKSAYRKVSSSNTSRLDAQADFFRLFIKGIFDLSVL